MRESSDKSLLCLAHTVSTLALLCLWKIPNNSRKTNDQGCKTEHQTLAPDYQAGQGSGMEPGAGDSKQGVGEGRQGGGPRGMPCPREEEGGRQMTDDTELTTKSRANGKGRKEGGKGRSGPGRRGAASGRAGPASPVVGARAPGRAVTSPRKLAGRAS